MEIGIEIDPSDGPHVRELKRKRWYHYAFDKEMRAAVWKDKESLVVGHRGCEVNSEEFHLFDASGECECDELVSWGSKGD